MNASETTFEQLRKLTILALFSDDDLMEILVLKGGNALELAYKLHSRASMDIDVSMEKDFKDFGLTLEEVREKIERSLQRTFKEEGFLAFDLTLKERPKMRKQVIDKHWGGYAAEFKVIRLADVKRIGDNLEKLRRESLPVSGGKKIIKVDISKYEFTDPSEETDFEDYLIRVYTPRMIIFEKLRAICQQMPDYTRLMNSSSSPRPRDFYDIYMVTENLEPNLKFGSPENLEMIRNFFEVKKVPLALLGKVKESAVKDFHASGFSAVKDTIKGHIDVQPFDFYYDYVIHKIEEMESLWA